VVKVLSASPRPVRALEPPTTFDTRFDTQLFNRVQSLFLLLGGEGQDEGGSLTNLASARPRMGRVSGLSLVMVQRRER
jgi:hypothetical protein